MSYDPPKTITLHYAAYQELVSLARAGVNDGAGRDEDMKRLQKHAERQNPEYKAFMKKSRQDRLERERQELAANKEFVKRHKDEELWFLEQSHRHRVKVRVLGLQNGSIYVKVIGPAQHLPRQDKYAVAYWEKMVGAKVGAYRHLLTPLDAQFGPPRQVKQQSAYEPGNGLQRRPLD